MRTSTHGTRRVATAVFGGAAALAVVGGSVLVATAAIAGSTTSRCTTTNGGTALVDVAGADAGLIDLGSTGGFVGLAGGSDGVRIGLLHCAVAIGADRRPRGHAPSATPAATAAAEPTALADIKIGSTGAAVHPAKDGHEDPVTSSAEGPTSSAPSRRCAAPRHSSSRATAPRAR